MTHVPQIPHHEEPVLQNAGLRSQDAKTSTFDDCVLERACYWQSFNVNIWACIVISWFLLSFSFTFLNLNLTWQFMTSLLIDRRLKILPFWNLLNEGTKQIFGEDQFWTWGTYGAPSDLVPQVMYETFVEVAGLRQTTSSEPHPAQIW